MSTRFLEMVVRAFSFLAIRLALLLTACGNGNVQMRFVNTSPGESSLDYSLDGTTVALAESLMELVPTMTRQFPDRGIFRFIPPGRRTQLSIKRSI
jgi:hypothetical protein